MLGYVYRTNHKYALSANQDLGIKVATPVGTFVGQLLFGWLADVVGRKKMVSSSFLPFLSLFAGFFSGLRSSRLRCPRLPLSRSDSLPLRFRSLSLSTDSS